MGIATHPEATQFSIDAGTARARVLEFLEDHGATAIAQYEAIAIQIPRPARGGG